MNNLELCRFMQAGDVLSVRTGNLMSFLIRMHETIHNSGRCYTNHNVPIVMNEGNQKYAVQVEPPHCYLSPLPDYLKWMESEGHLWHCARPAWMIEEEHPPGIVKAWQHDFSQYALGLDGKKYPKRDIIRLVIEDLSGGKINYGNRKADYCTEACVHGWIAGSRVHHVPDSVDEIQFPGPYDIEQLMRDRDILPVCGNSPWLLRSILHQPI